MLDDLRLCEDHQAWVVFEKLARHGLDFKVAHCYLEIVILSKGSSAIFHDPKVRLGKIALHMAFFLEPYLGIIAD